METKKTVKKKIKTLHPIKKSDKDKFSLLINRLKDTPDFQELIATIEDSREDYSEDSYRDDVLGNHGMLSYYTGARYALDNLLKLINLEIHPPK